MNIFYFDNSGVVESIIMICDNDIRRSCIITADATIFVLEIAR